MSSDEVPENGTRKQQHRNRGAVSIDPERCKGCGYCVEFCPSHVLVLSEGFNRNGYHPPVVVKGDACNGCDLCGMYCPDFAIYGVRIRTSTHEQDEAA